MLFMVIETFRAGQPDEVGARFKAQGRLMPAAAKLKYVASWMTADGARCYQLMEAPSRSALDGWIANWADLVSFEVVAVKTSADFWLEREAG